MKAIFSIIGLFDNDQKNVFENLKEMRPEIKVQMIYDTATK